MDNYQGFIRILTTDDRNYPKGSIIGPFESYEALCAYREKHGLDGVEEWPLTPEPDPIPTKVVFDFTQSLAKWKVTVERNGESSMVTDEKSAIVAARSLCDAVHADVNHKGEVVAGAVVITTEE